MSNERHIHDDQFERQVGIIVDFTLTENTAVRIYNVPPLNEVLPPIDAESATLKGGLRVNFLGDVPLLDGNKNPIGIATVTRIVSARLADMPESEIQACGLADREQAKSRASLDAEYLPEEIVTVFHYRVKSLNDI